MSDSKSEGAEIVVRPDEIRKLPPGLNELRLGSDSLNTRSFANSLLSTSLGEYLKFLKLFNEEDRAELLKDADLSTLKDKAIAGFIKRKPFMEDAVDTMGQDFVEHLAGIFIDLTFPPDREVSIVFATGARWATAKNIYEKYVQKTIDREKGLSEDECWLLVESMTQSLQRNFEGDLPDNIAGDVSNILREIKDSVGELGVTTNRPMQSLVALASNRPQLKKEIADFLRDKTKRSDGYISIIENQQ